MNPETFFDNFGMLADVPDGVSKLRRLILQLAVQGKLVPQNANDEPASVLLEKIKAEKERLVKEGEIKTAKALLPIDEDEIRFEIPSTWNYVRLNDVFDVRDGTHNSPKYIPTGIPLITSKNLSSGRLDFTNVKYISEEDHNKISERSKVNECDILFAMIGSIGNPVIVDNISEFSIKNVALFKYYTLKLSVPKFIYYFLIQASHNMREQASGGVQSFVSLGYLRNYIYPLPPLAEQKRIVTKVDQLMALCDELEARQQKKQEVRLSLNSAALDKLLTAHEPSEFAHHWQRVCDNFDLLYDNPETVGELRKAILQLAVQGRLVRQDANDEPAAVLLEKIKAEKERLIQEGEIRKGKLLTSIKEEEIPYILPKEWQWVRLEDLVSLLGDGLHGTPTYSDSGDYFFINGNNLSDGKILIKNNTKRASIDEYNKYKKKLDERTVLVSINGTLGNVAFYNAEKIILGKSACYFNLLHNLNKLYFKLLINTNYFLEYAFKNATGSTIKNVPLKSMRLFLVPLPPLAEQRRIVARVDQLMALCDDLEAKLRQSQTDGAKLMEAVVHKLVVA